MNDEVAAMMAEDKLAQQQQSQLSTAATETKQKRSEAGVKIRVGQQDEKADDKEKDNQKDQDMVEVGILDSENPYMTDMSGAYKKTINYGEMPLNQDLGETYI